MPQTATATVSKTSRTATPTRTRSSTGSPSNTPSSSETPTISVTPTNTPSAGSCAPRGLAATFTGRRGGFYNGVLTDNSCECGWYGPSVGHRLLVNFTLLPHSLPPYNRSARRHPSPFCLPAADYYDSLTCADDMGAFEEQKKMVLISVTLGLNAGSFYTPDSDEMYSGGTLIVDTCNVRGDEAAAQLLGVRTTLGACHC